MPRRPGGDGTGSRSRRRRAGRPWPCRRGSCSRARRSRRRRRCGRIVLVVDQLDDEHAPWMRSRPSAFWRPRRRSTWDSPLIMICHLPERTGLPPSFSGQTLRIDSAPSWRTPSASVFQIGRPPPRTDAPVIDVAAQVVGQVVAGDAHQVVGDHARVVGGILLGRWVLIADRPLRHGARSRSCQSSLT